MSKFERMDTFIKVIDSNSFSLAAKSLKISSAAVSKQISALEEELGVKLLNRTTRSLILTEAGRIYYDYCQKLLNMVREADSLVSHMRVEPSGHLHVISGRHFAETFIIPHLKEFMTQYPKVTINLELAERVPDISKENIDIVFGMSIHGPPDAIQKKIAMTRYVICASPQYLKKNGTPLTPKELLKHHYIAHSMRKPDNLITFKNGQQIYLNPILKLNDTEAMLQCALDGIGIVRLHDYMVEQAIANGKLVELLKKYSEPELPIFYYYQQSRYVHSKIRLFLDFIIDKIAQSEKKLSSL